MNFKIKLSSKAEFQKLLWDFSRAGEFSPGLIIYEDLKANNTEIIASVDDRVIAKLNVSQLVQLKSIEP